MFPIFTTDNFSGASCPISDRFSDVSKNSLSLKFVVLVHPEVVYNAFTKLIGLHISHSYSDVLSHHFFLGDPKFR